MMDDNILADFVEAIDSVQRTHKLTDREALTYVEHFAQAEARWLSQRANLRAQAAVEASLRAANIIEDPDLDGGLFG
ncbi:hypothetical protein K0U83_05875 [bacterium]|jgi:hypothetical protein|nr:hypothetical protein [bacterium]